MTIYSAQAPASLADMASKFKAKYGIDVKVNRQVDSVMVQQITAEQGSGKPVADLWVQASKNYTLGAVKNKWVTAPIGPAFYAKAYNRKTLLGPGPTAIVAAAVLGMAWNTSLYPSGINDIPDFLEFEADRQDRRTATHVSVVHRLVPLARGDVREEHPDAARCSEAEDLPVVADDDAGSDLRRDHGITLRARRWPSIRRSRARRSTSSSPTRARPGIHRSGG